jgi:hypothetical protein
MNNLDNFILNVNSSRKRTGIVYCSGSFNPIINQIELTVPNIDFFDCANLYTDSLTFSAKELLDKIENESRNKAAIIFNIETFIVSNSYGFLSQISKLLTYREPSKPLFFFFYSKKIFRSFKDEFESKDLNINNIIEL